MTTFQDPPLQSRRAVRQNERDQSPAAVSEATPEPLTYTTQGRPPVPNYDGPSFRARPTPQPADHADAGEQTPTDPGASRPRDFSPEGRRSADPTWAPSSGSTNPDGTVEYQTQQRGAVPSMQQPAPSSFAPHEAAAPTIIPSVLDAHEVTEHTLTRRELRALRDAHGITSQATGEVAPAAEAAAPAAPLAEPSTRLDSALAEFDQLAAGRPAPVQTDPPAPRGRRAAAAPSEPKPAGPAQIAPEALETPLVDPPMAAPASKVSPEPDVVEATVVEGTVVEETVVEETVVEVVETTPEPPASTPPTGHWSTQAQLDDETQAVSGALSRNIGNTSGAITTSALVLPSIPSHEFGPLSSGELMVTGSITLSDSFAATGAHPTQLDESHLDHLLDPGDHQVASTDSQPVRAIKAVSTHTSSGGVIQTVKPKGTRGLTALIIAATGMAVVVGALFIVLVATGQL